MPEPLYPHGRVMVESDQEPPGVLVLYNASQELAKGEQPQDMIAELGVVACAAGYDYKAMITHILSLALSG